jgi:hypothetical protein
MFYQKGLFLGKYIEYEVTTAINKNITMFCDVTPCSPFGS